MPHLHNFSAVTSLDNCQMKKVTRTQNESLKRKIANLSNATFSRKQTQILYVGLQSKYCQLIRVLLYIIQFDFLFLTGTFPKTLATFLTLCYCFFLIRELILTSILKKAICFQSFKELKLFYGCGVHRWGSHKQLFCRFYSCSLIETKTVLFMFLWIEVHMKNSSFSLPLNSLNYKIFIKYFMAFNSICSNYF